MDDSASRSSSNVFDDEYQASEEMSVDLDETRHMNDYSTSIDMSETANMNEEEDDDCGETELVETDEEDGEFGFHEAENNLPDIAIYVLEDISRLNLKTLTTSDVMRLHSLDLGVAYLFYTWYARINGFCPRKSKFQKKAIGEVVEQAFLCFREGYRQQRDTNIVGHHKRQARPETRCGCLAKIRIHIHFQSGRWVVTEFNNDHSHELLADIYMGMLPLHRRMNGLDIEQMNNMFKVGMTTPQIFGSYAHMAVGFGNTVLKKKDIYNQVQKQRWMLPGDEKAVVVTYMRCLAKILACFGGTRLMIMDVAASIMG